MTQPTFRSYMSVQYVDGYGSDSLFRAAARVSTADADFSGGDDPRGLLNYLLKNRHTSPFEHGAMTLLFDVPIFVSRELVRHRTLSFNETSARYRKLAPVFYRPSSYDRPMVQEGSAAHYTLSKTDSDSQSSFAWDIERMAAGCWSRYEQLLEDGVAREVARMVLPVSTYTQLFVSGNALNWLRFLSLRTAPDALYEIRDAAEQAERIFKRKYPITHELWDEHGRRL